jgi:hypothetical protein
MSAWFMTQPNPGDSTAIRGGVQGAMMTQFILGVMMFAAPTTLEKQRTKLLAEREAAPAETKSEYEEATAPPDIVLIGMLTGILSLFAVPFVFGPAAILLGVIATARGHLKGVVAVVLGIIGIAAWIAILMWLFPTASSEFRSPKTVTNLHFLIPSRGLAGYGALTHVVSQAGPSTSPSSLPPTGSSLGNSAW